MAILTFYKDRFSVLDKGSNEFMLHRVYPLADVGDSEYGEDIRDLLNKSITPRDRWIVMRTFLKLGIIKPLNIKGGELWVR